jgi:alpha-L-rhamnosidase
MLLSCLSACALGSSVNPVDLRCEYSVNPLGIDSAAPRLFWKLAGGDRGARQTAYQVLVASSDDLLRRDQGDLWDSGKVKSDQATFLPYVGKPLASRQLCFWKVRAWDQRGRGSDWSTNATWSMGLLAESDWHGRWIASDLELMDYQKTLRALTDFGMEPEKEMWTLSKKIREMTTGISNAPAVWLRQEFDAPKPVRRARVSVSGLGLFELYVNGQRISDHQLDPARTSILLNGAVTTFS